MMAAITPSWPAIAAVLLGHCVLHVALYNRVNSLGWPRWILKTISKSLFISLLLVPIVAMAAGYSTWYSPGQDAVPVGNISDLPGYTVWQIYGVVCLFSLAFFGIPFIVWRPIWGVEAAAASREITPIKVQPHVADRLARTQKCRLYSRLPGNQVFDLAIERCELSVPGLPVSLDGYKIAQLSDLHFTGHVGPQMTALAVDQANQWQPDLYALTGDIIDKAHCIDWLDEALGHARAADGCYFILGNHDTRVSDPGQVRQAMQSAGWTDVGGRCLDLSVAARGATAQPQLIQVLGNEWPWFARPTDQQMAQQADVFRLLLSHSPDQIWWARRHGVQLMLAGHTHGGQGRLPLIGPLLGPSIHGSRFASGDFYKPPTTMHVSRGLSGTHLVRIRCRPELSLITLRCTPSRGVA